MAPDEHDNPYAPPETLDDVTVDAADLLPTLRDRFWSIVAGSCVSGSGFGACVMLLEMPWRPFTPSDLFVVFIVAGVGWVLAMISATVIVGAAVLVVDFPYRQRGIGVAWAVFLAGVCGALSGFLSTMIVLGHDPRGIPYVFVAMVFGTLGGIAGEWWRARSYKDR